MNNKREKIKIPEDNGTGKAKIDGRFGIIRQ
jgi:hypothetical protein